MKTLESSRSTDSTAAPSVSVMNWPCFRRALLSPYSNARSASSPSSAVAVYNARKSIKISLLQAIVTVKEEEEEEEIIGKNVTAA